MTAKPRKPLLIAAVVVAVLAALVSLCFRYVDTFSDTEASSTMMIDFDPDRDSEREAVSP